MQAMNGYSNEELGQPQTVLIVDDDPLIRYVEAELLSSHGYNVLQADSAAEALRLADSAAIHLLLTDFSMPDVDGLELTRRFRAVHPETPVLLVSGSLPWMHHKIEALDHFAVLAKPFHIDELLTKARTLLHAAAPVPWLDRKAA